MITIGPYIYNDEEDLISSFKNTLKPKYAGKKSDKFSDFSDQDFEEYSCLILWSKENHYRIQEFPNVIQNEVDLKSFAYDKIKSYFHKKVSNNDSTFTWKARREIIDALNIIKFMDTPEFEISKDIEKVIKEISTGARSFYEMKMDEKLQTLNNAIEYILKKGERYLAIDNDIFYGYLEENDIKNFRNETQIFRHASEVAINERKLWSKTKKIFYIRLGIILVTNISEEDLEK